MVCMHLMLDVHNIHVSQLTYRAHQHYRRWSEHQKPTNHKKNYLSAIGINLPLFLLQPSSKLRKTLIPIWRIRFLVFHHYGNTPLQPYCAMTLLVTLVLPIGNGYTSKVSDILSWDQEELKAVPAQQVYSLDDHGQGLYLRTNQIKQMCGLITDMKHGFGL